MPPTISRVGPFILWSVCVWTAGCVHPAASEDKPPINGRRLLGSRNSRCAAFPAAPRTDAPPAPDFVTQVRVALSAASRGQRESILRCIPSEEREAALIWIVQTSDTGVVRNAAIKALGRYGSLAAYHELTRELLRPVWTEHVDFLEIAGKLSHVDKRYADRLRFTWALEAVHEGHRPGHAAVAIMMLVGYVPHTRIETKDRKTLLQLCKEFDTFVESVKGMDRAAVMRNRIAELFSIVESPKSKPYRVGWSIQLLSRYDGWHTSMQLIEDYVATTSIDKRAKEWAALRQGAVGRITWNAGSGEAVGLDCVSDFLFQRVGF